MMRTRTFLTVFSIALLAFALPSCAQHAGKPTESAHARGPNGLEGWTLEWPIPESNYGDERFALTLVIARKGKILRRIEGQPIIWKWVFWNDGKQIAQETGPFHFGMSCVLTDLATGRTLSTVDCYHELPPDAPEWVKALEPLD